MLGCDSKVELERLFEHAGTTLNAGCGVAWSEYLFDLNPETERHCVTLVYQLKLPTRIQHICLT